MASTDLWRPILAALANPESRRVIARLSLGEPVDRALATVPVKRRTRVRDTLIKASLMDPETGAFAANAFREALDAAAPPKRVGLERFLDGHRIRTYPASSEERSQLLKFVAEKAINEGEVLDEAALALRLTPFDHDVALLRRYLVDLGYLQRDAAGRRYERAPKPASSTSR